LLAEVSLDDSRIEALLAGSQNHIDMMYNAYVSVPLSDVILSWRGLFLEKLVRIVDEMAHPGASFESPQLGTCVNGKHRGSHEVEYGWIRNGLRIECKAAQLRFHRSQRRWKFHFSRIKSTLDERMLALYTPRGVCIYRHDRKLGITSNGKATGAGLLHPVDLPG
jgi:hypothetical protein